MVLSPRTILTPEEKKFIEEGLRATGANITEIQDDTLGRTGFHLLASRQQADKVAEFAGSIGLENLMSGAAPGPSA